MSDVSSRSPRKLSHVLAKMTLLLALVLGSLSGLSQIAVDLRQEKDAVEYSAEEFLISVAPSAASAVYNFYFPAAEQVVSGLFTQRAIVAVTIINEGSVMISRERETEPTLPNLGPMTQSDLVTIERPLFVPNGTSSDEKIGSVSVRVDRSIVAPAFVNRMVYYFVFATAKNFLLGILLIWIVYSALARHIVAIAKTTESWIPGTKVLEVPNAPWPLGRTELDALSDQIKRLAQSATGRIKEVEASKLAAEQSNTELEQKSEFLSQEVQQQNEQLQKANNRLKELAELDDLTGLYNRRLFDRLAEEAFSAAAEASASLSVLMMDVDFFKAYNDYYGHQAGDRCLEEVAGVIRECVADEGIIIARYGGEEFIALADEPAATDIEAIAQKIHQSIWDANIEHLRSTVADRVTVSISIAVSAGAETSLDHLISSADEALYEAKANGRNRIEVSSKKLRNRRRQERNRALSVFKSVEQRTFVPFFQPQIDATTGELVGVEALVRRRLEDGSYEAPVQFMQTAQSHGHLAEIDGIMLDKVSDFLARAESQNIHIPRIALNAPRENLQDWGYVEKLAQFSASSQAQVVLELLETVFFDEFDEELNWQLDSLREHGVDFEIDDFGTGHTSVISLMKLKPSRIKIARELVQPIEEDETFNRVVESVIQMSKAIGIGVMAEGVESKKLSDNLVRIGCPIQQGYHFAPPMDEVNFLSFASQLRSERKDASVVNFADQP